MNGWFVIKTNLLIPIQLNTKNKKQFDDYPEWFPIVH